MVTDQGITVCDGPPMARTKGAQGGSTSELRQGGGDGIEISKKDKRGRYKQKGGESRHSPGYLKQKVVQKLSRQKGRGGRR